MKRSVTSGSTPTSLKDAESTWHAKSVEIGEGVQEKERVLDAAYVEYCRLREAGQTVSASLFCDRYPTYRKSLRRLIDVHEAIDENGWDEAYWPERDSFFLGFIVHLELGVGAIARVYLASEVALGRRLVALKVSQHGGDEAEILGKLTHPNVVPVHSVQSDEETGMTAVCMPYLGSATLADVLEQVFPGRSESQNRIRSAVDAAGGPTPRSERELPKHANQILAAARAREALPDSLKGHQPEPPDPLLVRGDFVDGVVHIVRQLASGLAYTHSQSVLHQDLKPSNVLVTPSGRPMLLDFNLSRDEELNVHRMGGTLPYMAPEQIESVFSDDRQPEPADVRSDIFSLGIMLYELLTGQLPFGQPPDDCLPRTAAAAYLEAQTRPVLPVAQLNPNVSRQIARTVERCLNLDVSQRPQTAAALVRELAQHFEPRQRFNRLCYRNRFALLTLLLVSCVALSSWLLHLATRPSYDVRQFQRGLRDYAAGRYEESLSHFSRAAAANPAHVRAAFGRGVALMQLESYELAGEYLEEAAERLDSAISYECLAYSKFMDGTPRAAWHGFHKARLKAPQQLHLYLNEAFCFVEKSEPTLNAAIRLDPESQAAHFLRAKARVRMAEKLRRGHALRQPTIDNALADLDRALQLGPPLRPLLIYAVQQYARAAATRADLQPRLQAVLKQAIRAGCARTDLERGGYLQSFEQEKWHPELISQCAPAASLVADYPFLTAPDPAEVHAALTGSR